jgi:phosphomethylpyrimidine synthase
MLTLKQRAEQGELAEEIQAVAAAEGVTPEFVREGVARGVIAIPSNAHRALPRPRGVGAGLSVKVNANLGMSPHCGVMELELAKLDGAVEAGTDAVMDLSLGPRLQELRREILARSPVPVGTVPIYEAAWARSERGGNATDLTGDEMLEVIARQAEAGVDFMTIHAGVTRAVVATMERQGRRLDVVSRGGAMLVAWMRRHRAESPLYERFDEVLDILAAHDVTLSLGDGFRPGSTADATDRAQIGELSVLGELADRAWAKGVQVIIEGPGHVPLDQVAENMRLEKSLCRGAPFYILGPLVTDVAAGHDHIASAIGGAWAALHGADFLCAVSPSEHLRLPTAAEVRTGVIASRIAAQAADLARGRPAARAREEAMARARKALDWEGQFACALDPVTARRMRAESGIGDEEVCTMCGAFCAIRCVNDSTATPAGG